MTRRPQIVVTRPRPDSEALARRLIDLGFDVLIAPLLDIAPLPLTVSDIARFDALVITSRHALPSLVADAQAFATACQLPAFCVGGATAAAARAHGFRSVISGPGHAIGLKDVIETAIASGALRARDGSGTIDVLHPTTAKRAFDFTEAFAGTPVRVVTRDAYRVTPVTALSDGVASALCARDVRAVILMSARTSSTWARVATDAVAGCGGTAVLAPIHHLCLSAAVADALASLSLPPQSVNVAASTNIEDILLMTRRLVELGQPE